MTNSVVDNLVGLISPRIADSLASRLGEPENAVRKGLQGGSAAMLDVIACRTTDSGFLERIFTLIKSQAGVKMDRLSAEGYGEDQPIADNATEEGRAKNRRISLRVTEK